MKIHLSTTFFALFAIMVNSWAGDENPTAVALVRASQLDFVVFDALTHSNGRVMFEPEQYQMLSPCIIQNGPELFTVVLAKNISDNLSQNEIDLALGYFRSPVGKKYSDAVILGAHHSHQIDLEKKIPNFSAQEERDVRQFESNSVFNKLGADAVRNKRLMDELKQSILKTCGAK